MKHLKKLIAVIVMTAVCCVMAAPVVAKADAEVEPRVVCMHEYEKTNTDVNKRSEWHTYAGENEDGECEIVITFYVHSYICKKCQAAYLASETISEIHRQCELSNNN